MTACLDYRPSEEMGVAGDVTLLRMARSGADFAKGDRVTWLIDGMGVIRQVNLARS